MPAIGIANALRLGDKAVSAVYLGDRRVWPVAHVPTVRVTIDHTKVVTNLIDFPVFVNVGALPESFWIALGDGSDMRCSVGSTEVACEAVIPMPGEGWGELHIKVPVLSSTVDTVITIQATGGGSFPATAVWSNGYRSVYHLGHDPALGLPDSANGHTASASGPGATQSFGLMGGALSLDGATTMSVPTDAIVTGSRTMSAWVYPYAGAGNGTIWAQGSSAEGELWEMCRYNGNLILHAYGDGYDTIPLTAPLADEAVAYFVLTYMEAEHAVKVYVDGTYLGEASMLLNTTSAFNSLGGPGFFPQWNGIIDEARLSTVERSAAWIATEYANQIDPASFYAISAG